MTKRSNALGLAAAQFLYDQMRDEDKRERNRPGSAKKAGRISPDKPKVKGRIPWWDRSHSLKAWKP